MGAFFAESVIILDKLYDTYCNLFSSGDYRFVQLFGNPVLFAKIKTYRFCQIFDVSNYRFSQIGGNPISFRNA